MLPFSMLIMFDNACKRFCVAAMELRFLCVASAAHFLIYQQLERENESFNLVYSASSKFDNYNSY